MSFMPMLVSFIYQICLIVTLWKGWGSRAPNNGGLDEISPDKIKMPLLIGVLFSVAVMICIFNDLMQRRTSYVIVCSIVWVFQVVHNVRERNKKCPNLMYSVCLSITTMFHALYITLNPFSFYEFKPDYMVGLLALIIHSSFVRC